MRSPCKARKGSWTYLDSGEVVCGKTTVEQLFAARANYRISWQNSLALAWQTDNASERAPPSTSDERNANTAIHTARELH